MIEFKFDDEVETEIEEKGIPTEKKGRESHRESRFNYPIIAMMNNWPRSSWHSTVQICMQGCSSRNEKSGYLVSLTLSFVYEISTLICSF